MNSLSESMFYNLFNDDFFELLKESSNFPFRVVTKTNYKCIEYDINLNILTFCKLYFPIKITVIGFPVSICEKGYAGNLDDIIKDYRKRKGIFLFLNDDKIYSKESYRTGKTLPVCILNNTFTCFDDYLSMLRSHYRRRIKIALIKSKELIIKKIDKENFTDEMYNLYLNVLKSSDYPLEKLSSKFFKLFDSEIYCFFEGNKPIAFIQLKEIDKTLHFIFGGMDYKYRDKYDLYYNMLIFIIKKGIEDNCNIINLGQTAEKSKMRIGCKLKDKYMHILSGNKIIDFILIKLIKILEYKYSLERMRVFKDE